MTSKIVPWQKAVCIEMIDIGDVIYPESLRKELWVLPPVKNPNSDGSGYDPVSNMLTRFDPEAKWFPTNLLDVRGYRVHFLLEMLELKAEFSNGIMYTKFADWIGLPLFLEINP